MLVCGKNNLEYSFQKNKFGGWVRGMALGCSCYFWNMFQDVFGGWGRVGWGGKDEVDIGGHVFCGCIMRVHN
jgi:hypothetical protein